MESEKKPAMLTVKRTRRKGIEVSSRYMIPHSPHSAPSSPIHPSSAFPSLRNYLHSPKFQSPSAPSSPAASDAELEPLARYANENQHTFTAPLFSGLQGKTPNAQNRRVVRLFSDNTSSTPQKHFVDHLKCGTPNISDAPLTHFAQRHKKRSNARVGTPVARDRDILIPRPVLSTGIQLRPTQKSSHCENSCSTLADSESESCSISSLGGLCNSPPPILPHCRAQQAPELRSSMPETDTLPTISRKLSQVEETMLRRSHSLSLSSCQPSPFNLVKAMGSKSTAQEICTLGKSFLPPHPHCARLGKKGSGRKEDFHVLLLDNKYLQWHFMNAKMKVSFKAMACAAERSLSEVSRNLQELRDSVTEKRLALEKLMRLNRLSIIVKTEMPYLDNWALVDEEYTTSLSGTIKALQDASVRLPLIGCARVDVLVLEKALHFAIIMLESFSPSIKRFLTKTIGVAEVISELAKSYIREKTLLELSGSMLFKIQELQVKDCSLRSMLMQVKKEKQHNSKLP